MSLTERSISRTSRLQNCVDEIYSPTKSPDPLDILNFYKKTKDNIEELADLLQARELITVSSNVKSPINLKSNFTKSKSNNLFTKEKSLTNQNSQVKIQGISRLHDISSGSSLGPGKYRNITPEPGPSHQFDLSPRFPEPFQEHQLKSLMTRYASVERQRFADERIRKSKETPLISPPKRLEILKEKSKKKSIEYWLHKKAKELIITAQHEKREKELREKLVKFELRKNKKEIMTIQKSWTVLFVFIGSIYC